MPSTYSTSLRFELIASGEQSGTWGATTNTNIGTLIEQAISGYGAVTFADADYTLTTNNGALDEARNAVIKATGILTTTRNLIVPTAEKVYVVWNATTGSQSIVVKTSAGTGVTILNGDMAVVFCDGTNVEGTIKTQGTTTDIVAGAATFNGDVTSVSTDSGAAVGPNFDLYRNSATPAADDSIGALNFKGEDSAGNTETYARVRGFINDPTSTSEDGSVIVDTVRAGTLTQAFRVSNLGNVIIGEDSPPVNVTFQVDKDITGSTTAYGNYIESSVKGDVTTLAIYNGVGANTASNAGVPYTVAELRYYSITQGTFHADSTVTEQVGYAARATLVGAGTNYMFRAYNGDPATGKTLYGYYSGIDISTGGTSWQLYLNGTAKSFINGNVYFDDGLGVGVATSDDLNGGVEIRSTTGGILAISRNDTVVNADEAMGHLRFFGNDTTSNTYTNHGGISLFAEGTHAAGDNPTYMAFYTTPDGSATATEVARFNALGDLVFASGNRAYTTGGGFTAYGGANQVVWGDEISTSGFSAFGSGAATSNFSLGTSVDSAVGPLVSGYKARGGDVLKASLTAAQVGDVLLGVDGWGFDGGTTFRRAARILLQTDTDEAITGGGADDMPGMIVFQTKRNGNGGELMEALRIRADGIVEMRATNTGDTDTLPINVFRFRDTDTTVAIDQPLGRLEWWSDDATGEGAKAYILVRAASASATAKMQFATATSAASNPTIGMTLDDNSQLILAGAFSRKAPVIVTGDYTVLADDTDIISNRAATNTITLPNPANWTGRELYIKTITTGAVVSASSNVKPLTTNTAGTAILAAASDGAWARLVSDGSDWVIMAGSA